MLKFNPLKLKYKSIRGGVREDTTIKFFVESPFPVTMRLYNDNGHIDRLMKQTDGGWYLEYQLVKGLYYYDFYSDNVRYGKGDDYNATPYKSAFQLTVYPFNYATPDWIKGGIIYQIFPDRFCKVGDFSVGKGKVKREDWGGMPTYRSPDGKVRNNEFFGGNFKGITSKLNYLKSLNVNCVYLNPICESYSCHRYDTGDYLKPDSVLGTIEDFKDMTSKGKEKDISFIFDGVFNHTGAGSRYFNKYGDYHSVGAYNSKKSQYYDWYTFLEYPESYLSWWGFKTLPKIKRDSQQFHDFVCSDVISYWTDAGIKGIRLDVVDEISDRFVGEIRSSLKAKGDNLLIGEVWEDATNKIAYGRRRKYFTNGELDSVMNYPLRDGIIDFVLTGKTDFLKATCETQLNNYPKCSLDCMMNILSTHDSIRIITLLGRRKTITNKDEMGKEMLDDFEFSRGIEREKCASVLQFFMYGVPSVYYGDEEGLEGDLDPYNRRCYNWENGNKELLKHYELLGKIRTENPVFKKGDFEILKAKNGLFMFERKDEKDRILVCVNCGNHTKIIKSEEVLTDLITGKSSKSFEIESYKFAVLK